MKRYACFFLIALAGFTLAAQSVAPLTDPQKAKIMSYLKEFSALGTDPVVVKAVKDYNASPYPQASGMTQEKWDSLSALSPEIRAFAKNPLADYLKTKRKDVVAELFVSGANGTKVAFFGKTTNWNHTGKPKHDVPMSGKTWIGAPELDASSGKVSVQISFPVLDAGKPIGSIVVGLEISKL
jgi:hypothetical protein